MKKLVYIVIVLIFTVSLTSCGAGVASKSESQNKVAGYTLKNKKEIMERKILYKKSKTIVALP